METEKICIYHSNCADGFTAAWVVYQTQYGEKQKGITPIKFHPGVYNQDPPDVTGKDVIIVDFSYPLPIMQRMIMQAKRITVLDHHKTAREALEPLLLKNKIHGVFDMERSGAMIAWNWFTPNTPPPLLIQYVQDRDLWRFELPDSREFTAGLFSYSYDFDIWSQLVFDPDTIPNLIAAGKDILRKQNKDIKEFLTDNILTMNIDGYLVPVANLPYFYASDAAHILAKDHLFAAVFWETPQGRQFSLRSDENGMDVAKIAEKFGGGGHEHAAGFTVPGNYVYESPTENWAALHIRERQYHDFEKNTKKP